MYVLLILIYIHRLLQQHLTDLRTKWLFTHNVIDCVVLKYASLLVKNVSV